MYIYNCKFCQDRGCAVCPPITMPEPLIVITDIEDIKKIIPAFGAGQLKERVKRLGTGEEFMAETIANLLDTDTEDT